MAWAPDATGNSAWLAAGFTGELLVLCMLVIYSGAHEKVKRSHYETFWCAHRFFLLWVGPAGWAAQERRGSCPAPLLAHGAATSPD